MKVSPFHTSQKTAVYHNNDKCTEGNNIEKKYLTRGTGGYRLCKHCRYLNEPQR
jgi:hypothetical protein